MRETVLIRLRIGIPESPYECGTEPLGYMSHGASYII